MKIAIIGAGLAGLACAHELEFNGVYSDVYEDLNFIGDRESHVTATLNVVDRPLEDILLYFKDTCHMDIKPLNKVKRLTHNTPTKKTIITGDNLGYFYKRGKAEDSLKLQMYSMLKNTNIIFSQKPDFQLLSKNYDYVVVANGTPEITKELNCWKETLSGWIKGAVVEGEFDSNELIMWLNRKYCKNGYAYLTPFNNKKASLSLFIPFISQKETDYYWDRFIEIEKINYKVVEEFYIEHFSGFAYPHKIDNIYIIGAAGGAICPFLGFGQVNSISMGVFAAQSIIEGLDYEKLIKSIVDKEKSFWEIRKTFDTLTNKGYDNLLSSIGKPGIKQFIYSTNFNVVKQTSKVLKIYNKLKGN